MLNFFLLLARSSLEKNVAVAPASKGLSMEWGLVLIGLIIGLAITLMPPKRTYEVKKQKED
jgi:formate-dependent nitrite reductase membrane component NrfD